MLGHNVLRALLRQGYEVQALVRCRDGLCVAGLSPQEREGLCVREGSMLVPRELALAGEGCDAVVNCAGTTDMSLLRYEDYLPMNRDACTLILRMMQQQGIHRLVHVSTANTIGYGTPQEAANEHSPMQLPFSESYYARSKRAGEAILEAYAAAHADAHIVIVNPGFMIGPYDHKPSSGRLMLAAYRKPLMCCPAGGKSFVDVRDAATAIVNAIYHGTSGERYLLTGVAMSLRQFYRLQAAAMGYRQLLLTLPNWLALWAARVGDLLRCCGLRTSLSTRNVRQLLVREYYDNTHALRDLHLPQSPTEEAVKAFFAERGK